MISRFPTGKGSVEPPSGRILTLLGEYTIPYTTGWVESSATDGTNIIVSGFTSEGCSLFRSTNFGQTWSKVFSGAYPLWRIYSLTWIEGVFYAIVNTGSLGDYTILFSINGGSSFTQGASFYAPNICPPVKIGSDICLFFLESTSPKVHTSANNGSTINGTYNIPYRIVDTNTSFLGRALCMRNDGDNYVVASVSSVNPYSDIVLYNRQNLFSFNSGVIEGSVKLLMSHVSGANYATYVGITSNMTSLLSGDSITGANFVTPYNVYGKSKEWKDVVGFVTGNIDPVSKELTISWVTQSNKFGYAKAIMPRVSTFRSEFLKSGRLCMIEHTGDIASLAKVYVYDYPK